MRKPDHDHNVKSYAKQWDNNGSCFVAVPVGV